MNGSGFLKYPVTRSLGSMAGQHIFKQLDVFVYNLINVWVNIFTLCIYFVILE